MNNGHKESSVCLDRLIAAENVGLDFETIARSSPVDITAVDGIAQIGKARVCTAQGSIDGDMATSPKRPEVWSRRH